MVVVCVCVSVVLQGSGVRCQAGWWCCKVLQGVVWWCCRVMGGVVGCCGHEVVWWCCTVLVDGVVLWCVVFQDGGEEVIILPVSVCCCFLRGGALCVSHGRLTHIGTHTFGGQCGSRASLSPSAKNAEKQTALHCDGTPRRGVSERDGLALAEARRRKERTCHRELAGQGNRARLVALAGEAGGSWSEETRSFLRQLAKAPCAQATVPSSPCNERNFSGKIMSPAFKVPLTWWQRPLLNFFNLFLSWVWFPLCGYGAFVVPVQNGETPVSPPTQTLRASGLFPHWTLICFQLDVCQGRFRSGGQFTP